MAAVGQMFLTIRQAIAWAAAWARGEVVVAQPGTGIQLIDAWARQRLRCATAIEAIARVAFAPPPPVVTTFLPIERRAPEHVRSRIFCPAPRAARHLGGAHG